MSTKKPKTPAQQAAARAAGAKKAAATRAWNKKSAAGTSAREGFEAANPERFATVQDHVAEHIGNDKELHERVRRAGFDPDTEIPRLQGVARRSTTRNAYDAMGWNDESGEVSEHPRQGVMFPHPGTVPNPMHWEDMHPHQQARTLVKLAEYGISLHSATAAHGARMDRAAQQEDGQHGSFYSTLGESSTGAKMPKQVLLEGARHNGVPLHTQAVANAITSPNNRAVGKTAAGEVEYPNNEAANHAIQWAQSGRTGEEYHHHPDFYVPPEDKVAHPKTGKPMKAPGEARAYPVRGYPVNAANAIDVVRRIGEGHSVADAWAGSNNPKTGPFHNAWVAPQHPEGNFTVLDTHELESMAPHATQHEDKILGIPGVHAFNDYTKRQAMAQRGLGSVSRTQSMTWRSTKVSEGHIADVAELTPARPQPEEHSELPGQLSIEHAGVSVPRSSSRATDEPTWTMGDQKRHENTVAKRLRERPRLAERTAGLDPNARSDGWT